MSAEEIDDYLRGVEEPKRGTLEALRGTILGVIPDAEQGISYGVPAFRLPSTSVSRNGRKFQTSTPTSN